ncbi:interleukin-17 receptor E isoform X2 [Scleropages formosus]|uniref:interleukin-17 receptor E isoform X2 n=1 Tax=Scleropages formosus TaxID=113540 RepID=UPI0010FA64E8|nr:interleukin-17 receptor E-like isoform X2 [Scleropages formosus]
MSVVARPFPGSSLSCVTRAGAARPSHTRCRARAHSRTLGLGSRMARTCGAARAALALLLLLALLAAHHRCSQVQLQESRPNFTLRVDVPARTLTVSVATEFDIRVRLCYQQHKDTCSELSPAVVDLVTAHSPNATLRFPYLLPCLCVQVYFRFRDALRTVVCPFEHQLDGAEVWRSSSVEVTGVTLLWISQCPLRPSATLCWRLPGTVPDCLRIANSSLSVLHSKYDISSVDQHPDMCVQLALNGTAKHFCRFAPGLTQWSADVVPAIRHMRVLFTSSIPASFSAQLCVLRGQECVSHGTVHSVSQVKERELVCVCVCVCVCVRLEKKTLSPKSPNTALFPVPQEEGVGQPQLLIPFSHDPAGLCVQVWCSDPPLLGRRLFCPDCTCFPAASVPSTGRCGSFPVTPPLTHSSSSGLHRRWGLVAMAAVLVLLCAVSAVYLSYRVAQRRQTGWKLQHKPVLLVSSSERTQHVSAMCALASILQTELRARVRTALLAQGEGEGGSVADLGPLPWLYGQCETVRGAGGRVLLIWSPEGKRAYQSLGGVGSPEPEEPDGGATEPSALTAPILRAALAYLRGALQGGDPCHGFALVCFQGLCEQRDVPQELRQLPVFQLPRDFGALLQALRERPADARWRCWHSLNSSIEARVAAKRMAQKLRPWLPTKEAGKVGGGTDGSGRASAGTVARDAP